MNRGDLLKEITGTYQKFGWRLRGVLLDEAARRELSAGGFLIDENVPVETGQINAVWFSRDSGEREAWELRLLSHSPFALTQTFEPNTPQSDRQKIRAAMVQKLQTSGLKFKV